jgi:alginate O-acetyltransferase complex protein AlgJ
LAIDVEVDPHPYRAVTDLAAQLRAHGIDFLFVPIPTRLHVYPELILPLEPGVAAQGIVPGHALFLRALNQAGVEVVDLLPTFLEQRFGEDEDDQLFLRWNFHWTPRAAELAARRVADRLAELDWYEPGPAVEGGAFELKRTRHVYETPWRSAIPDEQPEEVAYVEVQVPTVENRRSPILVLGDSFVGIHRDHHSTLIDHLYRFTGHEIDVIAASAGGAQACRSALRRRADDLAGKRVVVWMPTWLTYRRTHLWNPIPVFRPEQPRDDEAERDGS